MRSLRGTPPAQELSKQLRKRMTPAEIRVWEMVRGRRLLGLKFRRQHPIRQFVVDFFCAERKLILELEGEVHLSEVGVARDHRRTALLESWGFTVVRLRNEDVEPERLRMLVSKRG